MGDAMAAPGGMPPQRLNMPEGSSMFNPADAALMGGQFNPQMTVRDALAKLGIDVDGPASQLMKFTQQQMQNRTMAGRLGAGRGAPQRPMVPQGPPPAGPAMPEAGGMEGLMSKLRT